MLQDLYTGDFSSFSSKTLEGHNWDILSSLWDDNSITFNKNNGIWTIREEIEGEESFLMTRDGLNLNRKTIKDEYGLLGLSLLDLNSNHVILTEGVSDYFTAKLLSPDKNVLGVTTLGGSSNAKKILLNLFDKFVICSDSDTTGITNAMNWKKLLQSYNKTVTIFSPVSSFKDITDNFIFNLKLCKKV